MWKFIRFLNENYWQIYINGSRYVLKKNKRWIINVYKVFGGDEGNLQPYFLNVEIWII